MSDQDTEIIETSGEVVRGIRFPETLWESVCKIAKTEDTSRGSIVRRAVREFIERRTL